MSAEPEVMYAIRRVDGEPIGDYAFITAEGPDDWRGVDDGLDDDVVAYEMVRMTIERVATKTIGSAACDTWIGDTVPPRHWCDIVIETQDDGTWPARDYPFAHADTYADAEIRVAMLPDVFIVADGYGAYEIRRDQLRLDTKELAAQRGGCVLCGRHHLAHPQP